MAIISRERMQEIIGNALAGADLSVSDLEDILETLIAILQNCPCPCDDPMICHNCTPPQQHLVLNLRFNDASNGRNFVNQMVAQYAPKLCLCGEYTVANIYNPSGWDTVTSIPEGGFNPPGTPSSNSFYLCGCLEYSESNAILNGSTQVLGSETWTTTSCDFDQLMDPNGNNNCYEGDEYIFAYCCNGERKNATQSIPFTELEKMQLLAQCECNKCEKILLTLKYVVMEHIQ